jgi:DNA polymerase
MILTIDFETFYDKEYSLSKITTEEYVRDPRFETIGVCVKVDDEPTEWFSGTHEQTAKWLAQFPWEDAFVLAHNMLFDGAILSWRYNIKPFVYLDTLCMARAVDGIEAGNSLSKLAERYNLGQKGNEVVLALGKRRKDFTSYELSNYARYCANDVDITYKLFDVFKESFNKNELKVIDLTLRMFTMPVLTLDSAFLQKHLDEVIAQKETLLEEAGVTKEVLMSNPKFAAMLESWGVDVPMKMSPTTKKITFALAKNDDGFKALAEHPDPRVQCAVAARLGTKSTLEETRTQRLLDISFRGSLPVPLRYYAAHTGRWGGDDKVNLQNIPRKSKIKQAICAPHGHVLVEADSSQIEARILAWLAGEKYLVNAFEKGEDVYKIMAAAMYHCDVSEVTEAQRFIGKTVVLGCGYGLGAEKFMKHMNSVGVHMGIDNARYIIGTYRGRNGFITNLWEEGQRCLEALASEELKTTEFGFQPQAVKLMPGVGFDMPSGIPLKYPKIEIDTEASLRRAAKLGRPLQDTIQYRYATKRGYVNIYGGKVVENVCQALARCVIAQQMLKVAAVYPVVLTVHDSIVCIAPERGWEAACDYVQECMRWRPSWASTLPLNCEVKYGKTYGTTVKYIG